MKMIFAGFGGQGILSMGQFMAYSGMKEGKEVSFLPAYGPEMRGGTCNCSVVISETPVSSPICSTPDILVAMNTPSLIKFEDKVKPGGFIFVNSSLIDVKVKRTDVKVYEIKANDLAIAAGTVKAANMVMTGAVCAASRAVTTPSILSCIKDKFSHKAELISLNEKAYKSGFDKVK